MFSRDPDSALQLNSDDYKAIQDHLAYLKEWKTEAKTKDYKFMSANTWFGLIVTLQSTLEFTEFLSKKGFEYFMTSRLSQDILEVGEFYFLLSVIYNLL